MKIHTKIMRRIKKTMASMTPMIQTRRMKMRNRLTYSTDADASGKEQNLVPPLLTMKRRCGNTS